MSINLPLVTNRVTRWDALKGKPYITVSAKGISNGQSTILNDGADFGPDTMFGATSKDQYGPPYSTTLGLWEAEAYAYSNLSNQDEVALIKVNTGIYNFNTIPSFVPISGPTGSYGGGSGFLPIYPNVAIDFQGSVINLNYTGSGFLQLLAGNTGLYLGYVENAIINVLNSTSNPMPYVIQTGTGILNTMVRNVAINGQLSNGNFNITSAIQQAGSNVTLENVTVYGALYGIEYTNGGTGTFVYNYNYSSLSEGYGNAHYINNYGDTIYIIGGRTVGALDEILMNASTRSFEDLHFYDRDVDAIIRFLYANNSNGYGIRNVFISGCWINAAGTTLNLNSSDSNASDSYSNFYITGNRIDTGSNDVFYISPNLLYGDFIFSNNSITAQNGSSTTRMFTVQSPNPAGQGFNFQISNNSLQLAPLGSSNYPNLLYFSSDFPVIFRNNFVYNSTNVAPIVITIPNTSIIENNVGLDSLSSTTNGTTAGTVTINNTSYSPNYKKYIIAFSGYENDTTTAQTIDFPIAFTTSALISGNNTGLTITATTSGITITAPDNTTTYSGIIIVEGY